MSWPRGRQGAARFREAQRAPLPWASSSARRGFNLPLRVHMDAGAGQEDGWGPGAGGAGEEGGSAGRGQGRAASCKPWMLSGGSPWVFPAHPPVATPRWAPGRGGAQSSGRRAPVPHHQLGDLSEATRRDTSKIAGNRGPVGQAPRWAHVRH